jgi:ComF family protein
MKMPRTGFWDCYNNPVSKLFWGRVEIRAGTSLFRFEKGSAYQTLLHDLKYRGNRRAGIYLGRLLGHELNQTFLSDCDLMIPVPLHRLKRKQRGYNQSELIARGASEITGIPVATNIIRRLSNQRSQTTMNRQERFENIARAFSLDNKVPELQEKKILIIDDIVTTGATLEACSQLLISHSSCLIYIATVSYA